MTTIHAAAVVRATNESLLLDAALKHAARRGLTPGSYLDVRRTAPDVIAFDVETILEGALNDAACSLVSLKTAVSATRKAGEPSVFGDVILVDRRGA